MCQALYTIFDVISFNFQNKKAFFTNFSYFIDEDNAV